MTTRLAAVLASLLLLLLPVAALAATPPALVEGVDYQRLDTPGTYQPVKKGEIEVVELFAYGCHHCADFAPMLEAWKAKQPKHVRVRYASVTYDPLARAFFAAQRIGALPRTHLATFRALHDARELPSNPSDDELAAYYAGLGVDAKKFRAALDGPAVARDMQAAHAFATRVGLRGTPMVVVGGRWHVRGGSLEEILQNTAALVANPPA